MFHYLETPVTKMLFEVDHILAAQVIFLQGFSQLLVENFSLSMCIVLCSSESMVCGDEERNFPFGLYDTTTD